MSEAMNNSITLDGEYLFSVTDYSMFLTMLVASVLIGVYFGFCGKGQNTTKDYLLGGKEMNPMAVGFSLVASYVSGITVLGIPAEIYYYGTSYATSCVVGFFVCFLVAEIFVPVFYNLQIHNSFLYLELRFGTPMRKFCTFMFIISYLTYIPIVIYLPALTFSQVSGASIYMVTPVICVICIFYTMVGGLRAVVWTDTLQCIVMLLAMVVVLVMGIFSVGGLGEIWAKAQQGDRIDFFNMDPSLTVRSTFWGATVGMIFSWTGQVGTGQGCVQKFMSIPTLSGTKKAVYIFSLGLILTKVISCLQGLVIFAKYFDCDPLASQKIAKQDQLLPFYVMDVARDIIGLPGLFMAGVLSAALSSMSAGMNTMSGVIYEDYLVQYMPTNTTERTASSIMKLLCLIIDIVCVGLVFVVEHLGAILQVNISLGGITGGPTLGIFTLGMMYPWANMKGTMAGGLIGMAFQTWMITGAQINKASGNMKNEILPLSVENCTNVFNITEMNTNTIHSNEDVFYLFRISHMHYVTIGFFVTIIIGMLASYVTGGQDFTNFNKNYIVHFMQRFLPEEVRNKKYQNTDYKIVQHVSDINMKNMY